MHPAVFESAEAIEPEVEALLAEVGGELPEPLDPEAGARLFGDLLLERLGADVALVVPGQAFTTGLSGGPISRGTLWRACGSSANPGGVAMSGAPLAAVPERGRGPEGAAAAA